MVAIKLTENIHYLSKNCVKNAFLVFTIIILSLFAGVFCELLRPPSELSVSSYESPHSLPRLSSLNQTYSNDSIYSLNQEKSDIFSSKDGHDPLNEKSDGNKTQNNSELSPISLKTYSDHEVRIDLLNGRTEAAMEKNASEMAFLMNFSLINSYDWDSNALINLTISNDTSVFLITTWSSWTKFGASDKYSLIFTINQSTIDEIDIGSYNLTITTNISTIISNDTVLFPMIDLKIDIVDISPDTFNVGLDEQAFNISIRVQEKYEKGSVFSNVTTLPSILDEHSRNFNPHAVMVSESSSGKNVSLYVSEFRNGTDGFYNFTAILSLNATSSDWFQVSPPTHSMTILVTTILGITDYDEEIGFFTANKKIYFLNITSIAIASNSSIDYEKLTNDGKQHADFRLNINDYINVSFEVYDELQNPYDDALISYQNPSNPLNPFDVITVGISGNTGTINLSSSNLSPSSGYPLLLYVKGHKLSQETLNPSNITIRWDCLVYEYKYYDNTFGEIGEFGTNETYNQRALGLDVDEYWNINVTVRYASDKDYALGAQLSYSFSGEPVIDITDDDLDALLSISYHSSSATTLTFTCQVKNGTYVDSNKIFYVDKTLYSDTFSINVTWTYLLIDMHPADVDHRVSANSLADIVFGCTWAHDGSFFTGILRAKDLDTGSFKDVLINAGLGSWEGLFKQAIDLYNYSVSAIVDDPYDVTKFTSPSENDPNSRSVQTYIIWDDVYFTFSNDNQTWGTNYFFAKYGEDAHLYSFARYVFDDELFSGFVWLFDTDDASAYNISFNEGYGLWIGDRSSAHRPITFQFTAIIKDIKYGVTQVHGRPQVTIVWDRIVVTLRGNKINSHGSWVTISVSMKYEVNATSIDISNVLYDIHFSNETVPRENVSLKYFFDYSINPTVHWYNITWMYDTITGLMEFEVLYEWLDEDMDPEKGNLVVYWIDDKDPQILQVYQYDIGNGTILIIVDTTDNSEIWQGSGIGEVTLIVESIDDRDLSLSYPINPISYQILSGIYRYIFSFSYNRSIPDVGNTFNFKYGDEIIFRVSVTDIGTPNFLGDFTAPDARTVFSDFCSIIANYDPFAPQALLINENEIVVSFITTSDINAPINLTDGSVNITIGVYDDWWSGLGQNSVKITIMNLDRFQSNITTYMTILGNDLDSEQYTTSRLTYNWTGVLEVGMNYRFIVIVTDQAGNSIEYTRMLEIEDHVAPRVRDIVLKSTDDRRISIKVSIEENGHVVEYVAVRMKYSDNEYSNWFYLSISGGIGGQQTGSSVFIYYGIITPQFRFEDFFISKNYLIELNISDSIGNNEHYSSAELKDVWLLNPNVSLNPLILNPLILVVLGIVLVAGIIIGIRIASRTVGYDIKKIRDESERIPKEIILTQMDEFALGVTVNFFDQVQGPVPVIWEPALLEDQQQVMLDLSDKSFSTLEFVSLDEKERSGIFDFSTGSYDCTALGYSFSIANVEARGGKENLTIVLLLRREWGDNLLTFQDEILEKIRVIRKLIEDRRPGIEVEKKARELREYVSRMILAFNKIYTGINYKDSPLEK